MAFMSCFDHLIIYFPDFIQNVGLTCICFASKDYLNQYPFKLVSVRKRSFKTGWTNVGEKTSLSMDLEILFTLENIHF